MKKTDLGRSFREAFGHPILKPPGQPLHSIDKLLEKLKSMGIKTSSVKNTSVGKTGGRFLKLHITTGTGRNRVGRQVWFNADQEITKDMTQSLHLPGMTSSHKGRDPWYDTGDYIE